MFKSRLTCVSSNTLQAYIWSIAPLMWGAFSWFMSWGMGARLVPYIQLNHIVRLIAVLLVVLYFLYAHLQATEQTYKLYFFGYLFKVPSLKFFIMLALCASLLRLTPFIQHDLVSSLIQGVIVGAFLEEIITRSFLAVYSIGVPLFIFLNTISSLAFTFMHSFYVQDGVNWCELFTRGHFGFSFMLGIIVYNTKRIEIAIMLHMLSNLLGYTVPVYLLQCPYPSIGGVLFSMFVNTVMLLALGGCRYKKTNIEASC